MRDTADTASLTFFSIGHVLLSLHCTLEFFVCFFFSVILETVSLYIFSSLAHSFTRDRTKFSHWILNTLQLFSY